MKNVPIKKVRTPKTLPVVGKVYEVWELPKKSLKTTTNHVTNRRARVGSFYPQKNNPFVIKNEFKLDDDGIKTEVREKFSGTFEGKTAQFKQVLSTVDKIKLSSNTRKLIKKDNKIEKIYNTVQMKTDISPAKCKERRLKKENSNFAALRKAGKITKY